MVSMETLRVFYRGRRVLVTGHTGFKGTWLTRILTDLGAEVAGYARYSERTPDFHAMAGVEDRIRGFQGDVRDYEALRAAFREFRPQAVFHLAAQPLVLEGYQSPRETYETNVMGTVNVLEALRSTPEVTSAVIVTTDKVYRNLEWPWGYRENDVLDGHDPYANSKSAADLATQAYVRCFFQDSALAVSVVRAGNVLGGGDFAENRIVPDCVRACSQGRPVSVRNPFSVRPYQHVLDPLFAYLLIGAWQATDPSRAGCYNIGPEAVDCVETGWVVDEFCGLWGDGARWINVSDDQLEAPHEAGLLKLDCELIKQTFGWRPRWHVAEALELAVELYKQILAGGDVSGVMDAQIARYDKP